MLVEGVVETTEQVHTVMVVKVVEEMVVLLMV